MLDAMKTYCVIHQLFFFNFLSSQEREKRIGPYQLLGFSPSPSPARRQFGGTGEGWGEGGII